MKKRIIINGAGIWGGVGNLPTLKANYYKQGVANFLRKTKDGLRAPCIMECNYDETDSNQTS